MEIVFEILKNLPSGWPRILVLVGLGLLYFLPEMRRMLAWRLFKDERIELAKQLLELRQLELTVRTMKVEHPELTNEVIDARIEELMDASSTETEVPDWAPWTDRIKYALAGSCAVLILGTMALAQSGKFVGKDPVQVVLIQVGIMVICGLLASAMPARYRWECVFRGFLIPALLGALMAAVVGSE